MKTPGEGLHSDREASARAVCPLLPVWSIPHHEGRDTLGILSKYWAFHAIPLGKFKESVVMEKLL
jgi:hypothetical protein